jgi:hypothetical protein
MGFGRRRGSNRVVLPDGTMLRGTVTKTRTHVVVENGNGTVEIPRERVQRVIRDGGDTVER